MYAANELRKAFWVFVRKQAFDEDNEYPLLGPLATVLAYRRIQSVYLQIEDQRTELPRDARDWRPVVYETLQDALLDFLIFIVGDGRPPDFIDWLRAQALIVAQAAREPQWLTVKTPVMGDNMEWSPDDLTTHTMGIAPGSWDTLSRETFDFIVRQYAGADDSNESSALPTNRPVLAKGTGRSPVLEFLALGWLLPAMRTKKLLHGQSSKA
jgi:hypothetical protein